jgi:hypothetical protein
VVVKAPAYWNPAADILDHPEQNPAVSPPTRTPEPVEAP